MNALGFAGRSLARQPARATLGILGVAAVGALLFDMLLLSQGLIVSMRDLLDRSGFDVRVGVTDQPGSGPLMPDAADVAARIATLPSVRSVITVRMADATLDGSQQRHRVDLQGIAGDGPMPWTVLRGAAPRAPRELLVNELTAATLALEPGAIVTLRAECTRENTSLPPLDFRISGVADFPFDNPDEGTAATSAASLAEACGEEVPRGAHIILVTSRGDAGATARAINALDPAYQALTNDQAVGRIEETGFTYFRQISAVLTTVTLAFALLLIAVLLTVSVNQRLGAIAALRALGFSRRRVAADVLSESALIVGIGGLISLPLGGALALWLDDILKRMPGIPADLHFFVFEWRAVGIHAALLTLTALIAALYPMRMVARLPIAATLRNEVIG